MPRHRTEPCATCPYKRDSKLKMWHKSEFEGLLAAEESQLGAVYACHQDKSKSAKERGMCAGWLLDQKKRGLPCISLRLFLRSNPDACETLEKVNAGGHRLYRTLKSMCRANGVRPRAPKDKNIRACPHCGDTEIGYIYKAEAIETRVGLWGQGSEMDTMTTMSLPKKVSCQVCGKLVDREQSEGDGTLDSE